MSTNDTTTTPPAHGFAIPGVTVLQVLRHPRTGAENEIDVRVGKHLVYARAIVRNATTVWVLIRLTNRPGCWQYLDVDGWVDGIAPHDPRASIGFCEQRATLTWDTPEAALQALAMVRPDAPSHAYRSTVHRVNDYDGQPALVCPPGIPSPA